MLTPSIAVADQDETRPESSFGVGVNARQLRLTRGLAELFAERAPPGTRTPGYSVEFAKRGERLEFVLGLGYDNLEASNGYYLENAGDPLTPGQVDFTDFDGFHIYSVDASVLGYLTLHEIVALRYGAGLGIGFVRGQITRTDASCTSDRLQRDCVPYPEGEQQQEPIDLPKALPVLNGLIGLQLRPVKAVAINIDLGLRNVPYVGASAMFYLW